MNAAIERNRDLALETWAILQTLKAAFGSAASSVLQLNGNGSQPANARDDAGVKHRIASLDDSYSQLTAALKWLVTVPGEAISVR
jgi:hypothetical protein